MTRRVTLTFDNGPDPAVTPFVLERLAAHGLRTTFFVLGSKISTPEGAGVARRAVAEGHRIGNHTYSHKTPLGRLAAEEAVRELDETTKAIAAAIGETKRLFRPYGGGGRIGPHLMQRAVINRLVAERYSCVLWNCVPRDFSDPEGWLPRAIACVENQNWSLVVMHDISMVAMRYLDRFLEHLESNGYEFREDFPPQCMPIVEGRIAAPLEFISGE